MRKNNFKKTLGMVLATSMMVASLTGCGGSSENAASDQAATTANEPTATKEDYNYEYEETADDCDESYSSSDASSGAAATEAASNSYDSLQGNYAVESDSSRNALGTTSKSNSNWDNSCPLPPAHFTKGEIASSMWCPLLPFLSLMLQVNPFIMIILRPTTILNGQRRNMVIRLKEKEV